jgi:hypothetical protein
MSRAVREGWSAEELAAWAEARTTSSELPERPTAQPRRVVVYDEALRTYHIGGLGIYFCPWCGKGLYPGWTPGSGSQP